MQNNSILWIFSPRYFSQQAKRPFLYKFDARFVNAAEEAVSCMSEQSNSTKIKALVKSPQYAGSVMPSSTPNYTLDMRNMSNFWTFMMVTINDKSVLGGVIRAMSDVQHLYYGFFLQEPINPIHHMGRLTINPDAPMMITHKTTLNKNSTSGPYGTQTRFDLMTDVDVVNPRIFCPIASHPTSLLRPNDLYSAVSDDIDPVVMQHPTSLLEQQEDPVKIKSALSVPSHNIYSILSSVASARGSIIHDSVSSRNNVFDLGGRDAYRTLVEQNLSDTTGLTETGLPVDNVITLKNIIQRYNPTIPPPVMLDRNPRYNPIDQQCISPRNTFSSMLSMVVPAIMAEFLIMDIGLYYRSDTDQLRLTEEQGTLTSFTPMAQEDLGRRVNGFLFRLKTEIFPQLKMNHGDFSLNMTCSCGGVTQINLNFFDDASPTDELFSVPTVLGGVNSPIIGTADVFTQNSTEIGLLVNSFIETNTDRQTFGQYDNRLNNALLTYDNTRTPPQTIGQPSLSNIILKHMPPDQWGI